MISSRIALQKHEPLFYSGESKEANICVCATLGTDRIVRLTVLPKVKQTWKQKVNWTLKKR